MSINADVSGKSSGRLVSLDVLRGFDMFFITGGATLITGLCTAFGGPVWLTAQMKHVPWAGIAHHDTIFPLFLFLAGVSWPFSLAAQRQRGRTENQIRLKMFKRVLTLFLIGFCFGGVLAWKAHFRFMSVLGFIGFSWGVAAVIHMQLKKPWQQVVFFLLTMIGYGAIMHFVGWPGAPEGSDPYCKEWNVIRWLDMHTIPNHLIGYSAIPYEPESVFAVPSGTLLALIGMWCGCLLKTDRFTPTGRVGLLFAGGLAALVATFVFVMILGVPVVKALWTISFIMASAAYSMFMLAVFYWIIDVRGFCRWVSVFDSVGKNSILVYVLLSIGVSGCVAQYVFGGTAEHLGCWSGVIRGLGLYLVTWLIARYCFSKNIFLKA